MRMVQGFLHPSPAICPHRHPLNLSRAPQRCQRLANTPRTIKAWRLWGQCMCAGCNGGLDGGKFNTWGWGALISQVNWYQVEHVCVLKAELNR